MDAKTEAGARQDADPPDKLDPFLVLERRDGSYSVAARAPDGLIVLAPLHLIPDPTRRSLLTSPCCDRLLVWSEFDDGSAVLTPFAGPLHDDGEPS